MNIFSFVFPQQLLMTSRKNKSSFRKYFVSLSLGEGRREKSLLPEFFKKLKTLSMLPLMLSVYFPVCSLALPRPETGTLPKQPLCSHLSWLCTSFPPCGRRHQRSSNTNLATPCRSFCPVICKIVFCLKERSPSVWSPSPWIPRVWVIIRWSGKRGFSETSPSQPFPGATREADIHSTVTAACTLLVVFNEPLPTRTSHFLVHHTIMYSLTEIAFKRNLELSLKEKNLINNHVFLLITFWNA